MSTKRKNDSKTLERRSKKKKIKQDQVEYPISFESMHLVCVQHVKEAVKHAVIEDGILYDVRNDSRSVNVSSQPIIFDITHHYNNVNWLAYWPLNQRIGELVLLTLKYLHDLGDVEDEDYEEEIGNQICIIEYLAGDESKTEIAEGLLLKYFKTDELSSLGVFKKVDFSYDKNTTSTTANRSLLNTFLYVQQCHGYI
jgi:hypothetical protein